MSAIQIEISGGSLEFLSAIADRGHCSISEAAEKVITEAARAQQEWDYWQMRAERGRRITPERWREIMSKIPDVPPIPGDELPAGWTDETNKH